MSKVRISRLEQVLRIGQRVDRAGEIHAAMEIVMSDPAAWELAEALAAKMFDENLPSDDPRVIAVADQLHARIEVNPKPPASPAGESL